MFCACPVLTETSKIDVYVCLIEIDQRARPAGLLALLVVLYFMWTECFMRTECFMWTECGGFRADRSIGGLAMVFYKKNIVHREPNHEAHHKIVD